MVVARTKFLVAGTAILLGIGLYFWNYMFFCKGRWSLNSSKENFKRIVLLADPQMEGDVRVLAQGFYGELNNIFNDFYYKNIFGNVKWFLPADAVVLLGDIYSSQYTDREEFMRRYHRFKFIFNEDGFKTPFFKLWGNHDIGYGSEVRSDRAYRFELNFGQQNNFLSLDDSHELVTLDSISLDGAEFKFYQDKAWESLYEMIRKKEKTGKKLILCTHIPLYKKAGSCKDHPYVEYLNGENLVFRQTVLSESTSDFIIKKVQPHVIFDGHDHEGCVYKHGPKKNITEYTVRAMLGDHGGYTGVYEYYKNPDGSFHYDFYYCPFHPTHVIIAYFIVCGVWLLWVVLVLSVKALCCTLSTAKKEIISAVKDEKTE